MRHRIPWHDNKRCPARGGSEHKPLNHETRTNPDGVVVMDRWFCSCGKRMKPPDSPRGEGKAPIAT